MELGHTDTILRDEAWERFQERTDNMDAQCTCCIGDDHCKLCSIINNCQEVPDDKR